MKELQWYRQEMNRVIDNIINRLYRLERRINDLECKLNKESCDCDEPCC